MAATTRGSVTACGRSWLSTIARRAWAKSIGSRRPFTLNVASVLWHYDTAVGNAHVTSAAVPAKQSASPFIEGRRRKVDWLSLVAWQPQAASL
jgi:hypothetical protein